YCRTCGFGGELGDGEFAMLAFKPEGRYWVCRNCIEKGRKPPLPADLWRECAECGVDDPRCLQNDHVFRRCNSDRIKVLCANHHAMERTTATRAKGDRLSRLLAA